MVVWFSVNARDRQRILLSVSVPELWVRLDLCFRPSGVELTGASCEEEALLRYANRAASGEIT